MNREQRHLLFADNLPLVGYLVSDLCTKAAHISREDLAAAGTAALISSSNSYNPAPGVLFGTFARRRITEVLAESMRDPGRSAPSAETRTTTTLAFRETLAGQLGRLPTIDAVASALGAGCDAVQRALADASLSLEPSRGNAAGCLITDAHSYEYFLFAAQNRELLQTAVLALPCPPRCATSRNRFISERVRSYPWPTTSGRYPGSFPESDPAPSACSAAKQPTTPRTQVSRTPQRPDGVCRTGQHCPGLGDLRPAADCVT